MSRERADAAKLLADLQRTVKKSLTVRTMPKPVFISQRQADREKAMRMIEAEMLASLKRCEELEREL